MPGVLGVDVSLGRGLDAVLLEDGVVKETWSRVGPEGLRDLLADIEPRAVGIDAPPRPGLGLLRDEAERASLPVPPAPGAHRSRRVAEYELSRRGIGSHQTHYEEAKLFSWMTAGFEAFRAAAAAGFPLWLGEGSAERRACEVFPYGSYVALAACLSPGRRHRLAWRRAVLEQEDLQGLPEGASIDVLDAACGALTIDRVLAGRGTWVGDHREGVIALPVPRLLEGYRRCAPPTVGVKPAEEARPAAQRLCECGCGTPVRRRFAPGHAARHRARLTAAVRDGLAARRELSRMGWKAHGRGPEQED